MSLTNYELRHEGAWGSSCDPRFFFTSALAGGEWSASRPCHFTPGEETPAAHWIWGWVGPTAGMDDMEKSCPHRNSNSDHLVVQPVDSR
jgi:hypothetical protein